ncbi:MAG: diacylglycerol kinase family protein [Hyphomicrobiales bacterium]
MAPQLAGEGANGHIDPMDTASTNAAEPLPPPERAARKARLEALIRTERSAVLVVNTHSRRGNRLFRDAKTALEQRGFTVVESYPVRHAERMHEIVHNAIARGHRFIALGGGDGSISSVVDQFAYREVVFGLLPLGTANSFARSLGVPVDLDGAIDVIASGKVSDVDLVKLNEDYFANGSSIGLPAAVGRATTPRLKRWFGRLAYVLVGAREFFRFEPFRCVIHHHGRVESFSAVEVRINNGAYQGGVRVVEEADPDSGDLVVQAVESGSRWAIPREWARVALRLPVGAVARRQIRASSLLIETDPPHDIAIDGEVLTRTPARISIAPNALMIMTPLSFDDRR